MTISGLVARPGTFPYAANTTVEDLIVMAGGLLNGASTSRVDVTRPQKDTQGLTVTGGLTDFSYARGARLMRTITRAEQLQVEDAQEALLQLNDSTDIQQLAVGHEYQVAIDLEKALSQPGGDFDILLLGWVRR